MSTENSKKTQLALGPVLYFWPREKLLSFYEAAVHWPVDRIYLGETVCSKRRSLSSAEWIALARELQEAGIEVVLSTLTLVEARSEAATVRRLCDSGVLIEANDYTAVSLLEERGLPFVGGHALNLYHRAAIQALVAAGMQRWVPPLEMSREQLKAILDDPGALPETELFAFGRMPLAWSARCFTARARERAKDECDLVCGEYPDGLLLSTQESEPFLNLNGIQTQSARTLDLSPRADEIQALDVSAVRLNPQSHHMAEIVQHWSQVLREGDAAGALPREWLSDAPCTGFWHGEAGSAEIGRQPG